MKTTDTSLAIDSYDTDVSKPTITLKEEVICDESKETDDSSYSSLGEPLKLDSTGTLASNKETKSDSDFGFSSDDNIDALLASGKEKEDELIGTLTKDQEKQIDEDIQGDDFLNLMNTENIQAKKSNPIESDDNDILSDDDF